LKLCKFNKIYRYETHRALNHPWITRRNANIPLTIIEVYDQKDLIKKFQKVIRKVYIKLLRCCIFFYSYKAINAYLFFLKKKKHTSNNIKSHTSQNLKRGKSKLITTPNSNSELNNSRLINVSQTNKNIPLLPRIIEKEKRVQSKDKTKKDFVSRIGLLNEKSNVFEIKEYSKDKKNILRNYSSNIKGKMFNVNNEVNNTNNTNSNNIHTTNNLFFNNKRSNVANLILQNLNDKKTPIFERKDSRNKSKILC